MAGAMTEIAERTVVTEGYAEHVATVAARWGEALAAEGYDAALVHAGTPRASFMDDYTYPFRANPHFLAWLPLDDAHDSVLWVRPGQRPVLWFFQPEDYWHLPPSDPDDWWAQHFDVRVTRETGDWRQALSIRTRTALIGDSPALEGAAGDRNPERLVNRLHLARTRKTGYEVACMTEANRVAAAAHRAAEAAFRAGASEFEIHQAYLRASRHTDAQLPYGNIVALDTHGAVLHYQKLEREPREARSFLIDAGATQQGYCSDITRTYAREPGAFDDLVAAMDRVQQALVEAVKPGLDYRELHLRAHRDIGGVLSDAGVTRVDSDQAVESGLTSVFYPHGLGHYIGLQTHDVAGLIADADGTPIPRPEGHPFLRLTRDLEAGNTLTIEPGLYFIDALLGPWREGEHSDMVDWDTVEALAPYGGIRVEDDVLVTDDGVRNLTRPAFDALN